jgi:ABC-type transport system involved in cytochrome bd biosynthesis fused ATPase/permease subunit
MLGEQIVFALRPAASWILPKKHRARTRWLQQRFCARHVSLAAATGALDDATEKALMETLAGLSRELTIILIAHRLSTTAYGDRTITVADGALRESRSVATIEAG